MWSWQRMHHTEDWSLYQPLLWESDLWMYQFLQQICQMQYGKVLCESMLRGPFWCGQYEVSPWQGHLFRPRLHAVDICMWYYSTCAKLTVIDCLFSQSLTNKEDPGRTLEGSNVIQVFCCNWRVPVQCVVNSSLFFIPIYSVKRREVSSNFSTD